MAGTRWVRLDVDYFRNPKALRVGAQGRAVHLASCCWVGSQLNDGHIPPDALRAILTDADAPQRTIGALVDAGLWLPNGDGGYVLHDFVEMNGTREEAEAERARWRANQRAYRARRRAAVIDDSSDSPR